MLFGWRTLIGAFWLLSAPVLALPPAAGGVSAEAAAFLSARPADAQARTSGAIRAALDGNADALNRIREAQRRLVTPSEEFRSEDMISGGRRVRIYCQAGKPTEAAVLYLHGGGWVLGGIESCRRICVGLARATGLDVAALDYRLAPEHRAGAALDDVGATVSRLRERGYRRIYLAGDSAGGNLAACAAGRMPDAIAGMILFYPVTLAKNDGSESWVRYADGYGLDGTLMETFNAAYAPGNLSDDPEVSPLLATDFAGYPETLIVGAECDILYDQGRAFAGLLARHGVRVTHRTVPGALHAFMTYPGMDAAYREGLGLASAFLRELETRMGTVITPDSIVRISRVEVDPARLPEYLILAAACGRESMASEPGVYMMFSMQEKSRPEMITILEIYADQTAYERHIASPHFQKYKQGTLDMVRRLELLDQTPLVPEMRMK